MKTLLIYPPWRQPFMPPLSLTGFTGHLEAGGVDCRQLDLNLETFDHLLTPAWLDRTAVELAQRIEAIEANDTLDGETALFHESLISAALRLPAIALGVEAARQALGDPERFYRLHDYRRTMRDLEEALSLVFLAWSPCRQALHGHRATAGGNNHCGQADPPSTGEERLLTDLFERIAIPVIAEASPVLLAVLTDFRSQWRSTLTLLRLVRRRLPGVKTAVAGWMAEELLARGTDADGDQAGLIDVLVSGLPGEPLLRLARTLGTGPLERAPGLEARGPNRPPRLAARETIPPESLCRPSITGLSLDRYFSPEPVIAVRASAGAADQVVELGRRHGCRRFLLTGAIDRSLAGSVADALAHTGSPPSWFASLGREEPLDEALCRRLAAGGCVKLQLRVGPDITGAGPQVLESIRRAIRFGPPAGIGIHLHCRLDHHGDLEAVTGPISGLLAGENRRFTHPGISFSCRVVRDGRLDPASGGSPPDLYNDATAPVPGAVPGFGRDPDDRGLPPEAAGEMQRWRLVRQAGQSMGPCLTPGTAVHDFLYLARFAGEGLPVPLPREQGPPPPLRPGMVLRPAPGLVSGQWTTYNPLPPTPGGGAGGALSFTRFGRRWRVTTGDGYHCRPLPDVGMEIIRRSDGTRPWEETAAFPDHPTRDRAERLVVMMLREGLLISDGSTAGAAP